MNQGEHTGSIGKGRRRELFSHMKKEETPGPAGYFGPNGASYHQRIRDLNITNNSKSSSPRPVLTRDVSPSSANPRIGSNYQI